MIEYRCSRKPQQRETTPVGEVRKDGGRKQVVKYEVNRLNEMVRVLGDFRIWSGDVKTLQIDPGGFCKAIRKLPREGQRALEEFFDLKEKRNKSPFNRWMIRGEHEYIWRVGTPNSTRVKGECALESLITLQQMKYVVEYDKMMQKTVQGLRVNIPGEEGMNYLMLYLTVMLEGSSFFYDSVEKGINKEKEAFETFDSKSLMMIALEAFKGTSLRVDLFKEFFELFVHDNLKKEILEGFEMRIPKELACIQVSNERGMTFSRLREIKEFLFKKGPWETVESLVEGRCRKVPGLATLRRASSYEWRHSYDAKFYETIGEKTLPNGENVKIYAVRGVKSSFHFSDLGEVLFLDHLYERGMI